MLSCCRRSAKNRRSAPVIGSSTQKRAMVRHASTRTVGARTNNNGFVRTSLQMQSKDFEQLCEFMMRVNPLYERSLLLFFGTFWLWEKLWNLNSIFKNLWNLNYGINLETLIWNL